MTQTDSQMFALVTAKQFSETARLMTELARVCDDVWVCFSVKQNLGLQATGDVYRFGSALYAHPFASRIGAVKAMVQWNAHVAQKEATEHLTVEVMQRRTALLYGASELMRLVAELAEGALETKKEEAA